MKRNGKQNITQDDVAAALNRFLKKGGIIKQLPEQRFQATGMVGADKYDAFESLSDLRSMTGTGEQVA